MVRVLIADDHPVVRRCLYSVLVGQPDIEVVGEAANGLEAIDLAVAHHPDVVIMDLVMPRVSGIEATRVIKGRLPTIRIIGLSMHESEILGQSMLDAGADHYLCKGGCTDELLELIRED